MKIPAGKTVYVGKKKYVKEIPDHIAKSVGLITEPVAEGTASGKSAKKSGS